MTELDFTTALRLRFGLDQLSGGFRCGTHNYDIDARGHHALSCQNLQGCVKRRHDFLRDAIFKHCSVIDGNAKICDNIAPEFGHVLPLGHHTDDEILIEQHATERTIPGDVVVKLSSDALRITYYDVTVVNFLTERVVSPATYHKGHHIALERILDEAHKRK